MFQSGATLHNPKTIYTYVTTGFHSDEDNSDDKNDDRGDNIALRGMAIITVCVLVGLSLTGVTVFIVYRYRNR